MKYQHRFIYNNVGPIATDNRKFKLRIVDGAAFDILLAMANQATL